MSSHAKLSSLYPFFIFLILFLGSGCYFMLQDVDYAFYQIPPAAAILPAIAFGLLAKSKDFRERVSILIRGIGQSEIITMCLIFILAGAFSVVTKEIGCVEAIVNLTLTYLSPSYLLPALFLISAFIGTSMGTSMGVIAVICPIAVTLCETAGVSLPLGMGAVVSGAMFGDNLSMISDTTIAAVESQRANLAKKFKLNAIIACISALIYVIVLFAFYVKPAPDLGITYDIEWLKVIPYLTVIILGICHMHVFAVLCTGILLAGFVGFFTADYAVLSFAKDIQNGFASMQEIMVLSMLIGGLAELIKEDGGIDFMVRQIEKFSKSDKKNPRFGELSICALVSLNDIAIANNTIAILLGGKVAKKIADKHKIPSHRSACFLDIFSCVFQGLLPYSAQILLAASFIGGSPISVLQYVYYCPILALVTLSMIIFKKRDESAA